MFDSSVLHLLVLSSSRLGSHAPSPNSTAHRSQQPAPAFDAAAVRLGRSALIFAVASSLAACTPSAQSTPRQASELPPEINKGREEPSNAHAAESPDSEAQGGQPLRSSEQTAELSHSEATTVSQEVDAEDAPRELLYRVQPDGLLISYDGLGMRPRARAERLSNGGYSLQLTVDLEPSEETNKDVLLSSGTPLSVFAKIYDKSGKQKSVIPDVMGTAEIQTVCAGCGVEQWVASWPAPGATPLWWGERVILEVGLWGIGDDETDRRPMKRLLVVEYKAGGRADPALRPPEF